MEEISFTTESAGDGLVLAGYHFSIEAPKAVVSLVHGLGEHGGRYRPMAAAFAEAGIATVTIDLRGHGRSPGPRGVVRDIDDMLEDVAALLTYTEETLPGVPHILMGHSMGGLLVLSYGLQRDVTGLKGIIAQAPAISPGGALPRPLEGVMKLIRAVAPRFAAGNQLKTAQLSRVPEEVAAYEADPLVHDRIGAGLYLDLVDTGRAVIAEAGNWRTPLLLLHGSDDAITLPGGSAAFAAATQGPVTHEEVSGGYHELHNDLCREEIHARLIGWMEERIAAA